MWDASEPLARATHVDAIVDDVAPGLHFVPSTIPAGLVDITLMDRRNPAATGAVTLQSSNANFPINITDDCARGGECIDGGSGLVGIRWYRLSTKVQQLGNHLISAAIVGGPPCCADATITVVAPTLAPPGEPENEVHVSVFTPIQGFLQPKYQINTPDRESRLARADRQPAADPLHQADLDQRLGGEDQDHGDEHER